MNLRVGGYDRNPRRRWQPVLAHVFGVLPQDLIDMTPSEIADLWRYIDALNQKRG